MHATKGPEGNVMDEMVAAVFPGVTLAERASRNTAARSALSKPPEQVDEFDLHTRHPLEESHRNQPIGATPDGAASTGGLA